MQCAESQQICENSKWFPLLYHHPMRYRNIDLTIDNYSHSPNPHTPPLPQNNNHFTVAREWNGDYRRRGHWNTRTQAYCLWKVSFMPASKWQRKFAREDVFCLKIQCRVKLTATFSEQGETRCRRTARRYEIRNTHGYVLTSTSLQRTNVEVKSLFPPQWKHHAHYKVKKFNHV